MVRPDTVQELPRDPVTSTVHERPLGDDVNVIVVYTCPLYPANDADTVTERSPATTDSICGMKGRLGGRTVVGGDVGRGKVEGGTHGGRVGRVMGNVGGTGAGDVVTVVGAVDGEVGKGAPLDGGGFVVPGNHWGSTYNNPFGEPPPPSLTTLTVALDNTPDATADGAAAGQALRNAAAAPATWGEAIEVPDNVLMDWLPPIHALTMDDPGANRSRHGPMFE